MSNYNNPKAPLQASDQKKLGAPPRATPKPQQTQLNEQEENEREQRRQARRNCCKKALKFMFSHIGLCAMVCAYSVAGGFIFQHLEKTNEKQECVKAQEKYEPLENSTKYNMWDISSHFRKDEDIEFALVEFQKMLVKFRDDVLALSYDGTNCSIMGEEGGPGYQWSFPGALLFSVTVITTIGYGNIAPKTFWGRLVCIAYATLGIPLMLLCLANIGDVMADIFRFVYTKVCCCGCCRRKIKAKPGAAKAQESTPEAWKNQYAKQQSKGPLVVDDDDDDDDDEEEDKISVPLTITMCVIAGFIFMGALLFGVWEKWDPLKASYFCFVTISTIGFGDVVPGSANFDTKADQYKMVGAAVYMLFGMAILSMCFSLIQEEIVAKFKWVGEKIGIIERGDDDKDDDADDNDAKQPQGQQQPPMGAGRGKRMGPPGGPVPPHVRGMPPPGLMQAKGGVPPKMGPGQPPIQHRMPTPGAVGQRAPPSIGATQSPRPMSQKVQ